MEPVQQTFCVEILERRTASEDCMAQGSGLTILRRSRPLDLQKSQNGPLTLFRGPS